MTWEDRFWEKVEPQPNGCWLWTGTIVKGGYGRAHRPVRLGAYERPLAHRVSYELLIGPIPEGLVLDHLCRNPPCVNPDHLEPVTNRVNVLRGEGPPARNARKTQCKRGHDLTGPNLHRLADGYRECRTCRDLHSAAFAVRAELIAALGDLMAVGGGAADAGEVHDPGHGVAVLEDALEGDGIVQLRLSTWRTWIVPLLEEAS